MTQFSQSVPPIATQAEMEAGIEAARRTVSPLLVAQAIAALGGGGGDVVGPASAVDDRIATFDGVTGKLLQDGGQTIAQVVAAGAAAAPQGDVVGPASATDGVPALFDGTTGKLLKNSTPAQVRTVTFEEQVATAGVAVTTLTLTPTSTLTDGVYRFIFGLKSLDNTATFRMYFNGDGAAASYRRGNITSGGSTSDVSSAFTITNVAVGETSISEVLVTLKNGSFVNWLARSIRTGASTNRTIIDAGWFVSGTTLTSIQFTGDVANKIDATSFIAMGRIY